MIVQKKKLGLILYCLLIINTVVFSQKIYHTLGINDTLPPITVNTFYRTIWKTEQLRNLHTGKLLILDLFATWCGPCVKALPKLDTLAEKYKNKLEIVAVTSESRAVLLKYIRGRGHLINSTITFIAQDSLLYQLFPHRVIPTAIWIDSGGRIIANTTDDEINDQKLQEVFGTGSYTGYTKTDNMQFSIDSALGIGNNTVPDSDIVFRSILTKQIAGMNSSAKLFRNKAGKPIRFAVSNLPMIHLYSFAFSHAKYATLNFNRMILDLKDSLSYLQYGNLRRYADIPPRLDSIEYDRQWGKDHLYCYDLVVPQGKSDSIFEIMFDQLNQLSPLKGKIILNERPCWVIVRTNSDSLPISNSSRQWSWDADTLKAIRHVTISELVQFINQIKDIIPVFDETGWNEPVDMDLNIAHHDKQFILLSDLRKAVAPYGLEVKEEKRQLPVLFLSDH